MYDVSAIAVRRKGVVEVTITGILPSSYHKAKITDHYPGGNIVYVRDPGEAQVFIKETVRPGDVLCPLVLVPWAETVRFKDKQHDKVSVYSGDRKKVAEVKVVDMKTGKDKGGFIVISLLDREIIGVDEPVRHKGCSIVPKDAVYPAIYRRAFGPASLQDCRDFVSQHCGTPKDKKTEERGCSLALHAERNLKEQPNGLYVHGSVLVYTAETTVVLTKAEPQGINPEILLLDLTVTENPGPMKGIQKPFFFEDHGDHVTAYTQVQVRSNKGDSCTIDIRVRG